MNLLFSLKQGCPWWIRVGAKIILARFPVPYTVWKHLRLFEHGDMNRPQCAFDTLIEHAQSGAILDGFSLLPRFADNGRQFNVLELGPGDSLFTAIISKVLGASHTWLVDVGPFATKHSDAFIELFDLLRQKGFALPASNSSMLFEDILRDCNAQYLTDGIQSLSQLQAASIDFCFSNAVLEHIPKEDFVQLADELSRILKPGGVCVHRVDFQDHLGGSLNNLRFTDRIWEGLLFRNSGFYTNRIRFGQMKMIFECAGFECSVPRLLRWDRLPISRSKFDSAFSQLTDDDLLIYGCDIVLKRKL